MIENVAKEVSGSNEFAAEANGDRAARDAGLSALVLIARFHSIAADADQIQHAAGIKSIAFDERELLLAARSLGLKARKATVTASHTKRVLKS